MYQDYIEGMTDSLVDAGIIAAQNKALIAECLANYWSDKIADIWVIADVKSLNPDLSDDQCVEILDTAIHSFDASVGINWDVLQGLVDTFDNESDESE